MAVDFNVAAMKKLAEEDLFIAHAVTNMIAKNANISIENIYEIIYNSYVLDGEDDMKEAYQQAYNKIYC